MAFLNSSQLFTYVMESTPGAFVPAVSATDIDVRLREMDWSNENERDNESSEYMTGTWFGSDESIVGKKRVTASYSLKIAPGEYTPDSTGSAGDAGHKLNYDDLLTNCGLTKLSLSADPLDDMPGMYVFYPEQDNSEQTMSIAQVVYDSESDTYQIAQAAGCVSNFSIAAEGTAMPFTISFDTQGRSEGVIEAAGNADVATLDETNVMRTVADAMRNTVIKIKDLETDVETEFFITSLTMESGNEVNEIESQATDSGLLSYIITKINPSIVIDPLLKSLSDFNWWDAVSTERFYSLSIDSEYVHIFVPRAQINTNSVGEANGFLRNELNFRCLINIDGEYPTWIPVGDVPANVSKIPYFLGIEEKLANY